MKKLKILFFISLCINIFFISYTAYNDSGKTVNVATSEIIKVPIIQNDTMNYVLSDWDIFTMSLMYIESGYDSTAVSNKGAKGYFQITPIYIKEVNIKQDTNYSMKDVINFEKAYNIFDLMQKTNNKDYDINKAIILHNGNHSWYSQKIMKKYEEFKKYEYVRNRLVNHITKK